MFARAAFNYGKVGEAVTDEVLENILNAQTAAQPFVYPSGLLEIPMSPISDVGAFRSTRWPLDSFVKTIGRCVEWAIENRSVFDFLAHPSCLVVEDPDFRTIRRICEIVRAEKDRAEIVGLDRIAEGI